MKAFRQRLLYLALMVLSAGLWSLLHISGFLDGLEEQALRWRYQARGEIASEAPIVFVNLDAETVSYMGDRPWDRKEFAVLIEALLGPGAADVVSLDIIFSKFGAGALLDVSRARKGDVALGKAVERYADQVVLASAYTGVRQSMTDEVASLPLIRRGAVDPSAVPFPEAPAFPIIKYDVGRLALANVDEEFSGGAVPYWVPAFVEISGSRYAFHIVDGALRHFEHVLNQPEIVVEEDRVKIVDQDGWEPLSLPRHHEMQLLSLGLETFLAAHELGADSIQRSEDALQIVRDGERFRTIPLVAAQSVEVNWFEGWPSDSRANHVSMQLVLRQAHALAEAASAQDLSLVRELELWFEQFRDKVVFVGPVDPQLKDIAPTPFNRSPVPKVGLHANLYRTIESEAYIGRIDLAGQMVIICLLTVAVASFVVLGGKGPWGLLRLLSPIFFLTYGGLTFWAFAHWHLVLPLVAPAASALTASLCVVILKLGSEEWQRRRIKTLFGAYVAPKLVDEMVDSQQDPKLGGTEAEISALFSDVEGFSALSEELSPDRLVALMNEYLGAMTEAFQAQAGTLDKYIGDAIVTMFGMPVPVQDHAARACLSALSMQARHAELRATWAASGEWPESVVQMRTRIGINTGRAVIGNMGSEVRFNYTMMGDSVNLAARCESGAKSYGVYTMVTADTLDAALEDGADLSYRKLDRIVVKGRRRPVEIYELWDTSVAAEESEACRLHYERGLALYFSAQWQSALEAFDEAAAVEPSRAFASTTPSAVLAQRCREFIERGGPEDWDGSYRMQSK